jgi:glycosyltransferase involved in cell wall biosynthesis
LNGAEGRVSVVVPFHNPGSFLQETIESVLAQSYTDWELLLVDDGSSDGSSDIASDYARLHPGRIFHLGRPGGTGKGCSHARNVGLRHASGSFLASLDADDVWLPHKLEEQVALLREHPEADAVYGRTFFWSSWQEGSSPEDDAELALGFENGTVVEPPRLLLTALEGAAPLPQTSSIMVRRAVAERVGGYEEAFPILFEDQVFHTKLFLEAPALVVDRTWSLYRQHARSIMAQARRDLTTHSERLRYLDWAASYMARRGLRGTRIWWVVERTRLSLRYPRTMRFVRTGVRAARAAVGLLSGSRNRGGSSA